MHGLREMSAARPQNGRLRDGMGAILGYARVSTGDQDVAGQTMRLTQTGAIKVFSDVHSGRTMERPGLEALLAYAREGDTLAIVRLDRLGRSLGELLTTVAMLKERGIALLSLEERIDTNSAAGELVFHVFGAIAHFERRLIAERTKDGIAAARVRGKLPGRRPLGMRAAPTPPVRVRRRRRSGRDWIPGVRVQTPYRPAGSSAPDRRQENFRWCRHKERDRPDWPLSKRRRPGPVLPKTTAPGSHRCLRL